MKYTHVILAATCAAALAACGGGSTSEDDASSSSDASTQSSAVSLESCRSLTYPGDTSDPQSYSFDAIAQFDACAHQATGDNRYVVDGNNQCKVLAGLIASTGSRFQPLFCSGSLLKL